MSPQPRKPLPVHKLQNTKPEYVVVDSVVEPGRPKYPRGLSPDAKKAFKKLCGLLEQRRSLTAGDGELLRLWAVAFVRHEKAVAKLAEEGEIKIYYRLDNHGESVPSERPNLWLKVAQDAEKLMLSVLDRLGLTPMNRSKVKSTEIPKEKLPSDPLEELLSRSGQPTDATATDADLDGLEDLLVN